MIIYVYEVELKLGAARIGRITATCLFVVYLMVISGVQIYGGIYDTKSRVAEIFVLGVGGMSFGVSLWFARFLWKNRK